MGENLCANCGYERREHTYNGACYGICGEFVEASPATSLPEDVARVVERLRRTDKDFGVPACSEAASLIQSLSSQFAEARAELDALRDREDDVREEMYERGKAVGMAEHKAERDRLAADVSEFMTRLGPRWFLDQGWFPASQQEEKRAALDTAKGAGK